MVFAGGAAFVKKLAVELPAVFVQLAALHGGGDAAAGFGAVGAVVEAAAAGVRGEVWHAGGELVGLNVAQAELLESG